MGGVQHHSPPGRTCSAPTACRRGREVSRVATDRPSRKPREKRGPRPKTGESINIRVTAEEKRLLIQEAGEVGISKYVRKRLFDGGLRDRDKLREIAVLHVLGRRIQDLAEKTEIDADTVADTLGDICAAIGGLTVDLDDASDGAPTP